MDSLNLSETQNTSLNFRSTADSSSQIVCPSCGSKNYIQIVPQSYSFRVQPPEITNCKRAQECFEQNFTNPQAGFLPFPFFQPFFHSNPFPVNYYVHNHLEEAATKEERQEVANDKESIPNSSNQGTFCQKEKNECIGNKTTINEGAQKCTNTSGPELQFPGYPFNFMNPNFNAVYQPSSWSDFAPWTCNPFIAPFFSYYLFWNSHKFNANPSLKTHPSNKVEPLSQKSNKNTSETYSRVRSNSNENFPKNAEKECDNNRLSSTKIQNSSHNCYLGDKKYENYNQSSRNTSANSSNSDLNYSKPKSFISTEKEEEAIELPKISSDSFCEVEGDGEIEIFNSAMQIESDECFKIDGNDFMNFKTSSTELKDEMTNNNIQSLTDGEISYLMAEDNSGNAADVSYSEMQNSSDESLAEENVILFSKGNESREKTPAVEMAPYEEQKFPEKALKNFTEVDETNDAFFKKKEISGAGDLGGENCAGYRVTIVSIKKENNEKSCQETENEESLESKESEKIKNENSKSVRVFKSGIAKLTSNTKPKEPKTDKTKNLIRNKELSQKELRKHNCVTTNNIVSANDNSKIQKMRTMQWLSKKLQERKSNEDKESV